MVNAVEGKVGTAYEAELSGTITFLSKSLNPELAPYRDGLLYARRRWKKWNQESTMPKDAIIVFVAMRDRRLLPGTAHHVGDRILRTERTVI